MFRPLKKHEHDLPREFQSYLYKYKEEFANTRRRFNKASIDADLTDQEIRDIYTKTATSLRRKNQELLMVIRAMARLGVSSEEINARLDKVKIGEAKKKLLLQPTAAMDRPSIPNIISSVRDKEFKNTDLSGDDETEG